MKFAKTSIAAKEENYHQLMETLLAKFSERCDAAGVRHTEFEMQGGRPKPFWRSPITLIAWSWACGPFTYESGAGKDGEYGTADDEPGDSLEQIMKTTLAPVFAVPLNWKPDDHFSALIAHNGSPHSMRALRQLRGCMAVHRFQSVSCTALRGGSIPRCSANGRLPKGSRICHRGSPHRIRRYPGCDVCGLLRTV